MKTAPFLRLFAWIAIAIAISAATFHFLAPDSPEFIKVNQRPAPTYQPPASFANASVR